MATVFEELLASTQTEDTSTEEVLPTKGTATAGDYLFDVVKAPIKGASKAVQGLLQLGVLPIDYLANTNLINGIDDIFNKITPDTKTGIGDIAATLVQYGAPLGVATKLAGGIKFLNRATETKKLSSLNALGKTGELVRRAGYYGTIGGISDFVASVPGDDKTLSETFGLTETSEKDIDQLEGSDKAKEVLKEKLKFGAEGTVIGGAIPLLAPVGSLGVKYGLVPGAKVVSAVAGPALKAVDYAVVNPLSKLIAGTDSTSLIPKIISKGGELIDTAITKTGLPKMEDWKFSSSEGNFGNKITRALDTVKNQFASAGPLGPVLKAQKDKIDLEILAKRDTIGKYADRIDNTLEDIVNNFKTKLFDEGESMLSLQVEKNKIFDYLTANKDQAEKAFQAINPAVRNEAKNLKQILKESNLEYGKFLSTEAADSYKRIGEDIIQDADGFFRQRFAAFNNPKFRFDPSTNKEAVETMEKVINSNKDLRMIVKEAAKTTDEASEAYKTELKKQANNRLDELKKRIIYSDRSPEVQINELAKSFRVDLDKGILKPGEQLPDVVKRLFSSPEDAVIAGKKIPVTDYRSALIDTITQQSKDIYSTRFFNFVEKFGLENNIVFRNLDEAIAKGKPTNNLQTLQQRGPELFYKSSDLFNKNYYTTPEIANALLETKAGLDRLFDIPFYKSLMTIKSAAQVFKTIFSPVTQVRNVSTASFFPLASGLIGGRASLKDSFKLVAEDIFTGSKTNLENLVDYIEDGIRRGVLDQNIQVNEVRNILERARGGKINFETFMNTPIVKKLTDVYQGGDNIWKIYSDKFYQSALQPAIKNFDDVTDWYKTVAKQEYIPSNPLTGQTKTLDEAIKDISAYLVTNTIPTYSKVPEIIKNLRALPFGNFIAFPAEILRTSSNLLTLGARELTSSNPFIRQMGARRLIGTAATFGGVGTIVQQTAESITGVGQDIMDSFQRSFAPEYQKNSTLIPLTKPDENGKFKYVNFSYSNPYNSILQPINAVLKAYGDGTLNKDSVDKIVLNSLFGNPVTGRPGALTEFFSPFVEESIGTERAFDIIFRDGRKQSGGRIFYPTDDLQTKIARGLEHVMGGLTPGAFTSAQRVWEGATGKFTDAGTLRDSKNELVALMSGIRVEEAKPKTSMPFIITAFNEDKKNIGSKFSSIAYSAGSSQEEKIDAYKNFILDSFNSQNKLYQTIKDAQKLGVDEGDLKTILFQRIKNKTDVNNLLNGVFKTPSYSIDRFRALVSRLESEDPVAAAKFESQIDNVKDIYKDLQNELRGYDLGTAYGDLENKIDRLLTPPVRTFRKTPAAPIFSRPSEPRVQLPTNISTQPNTQPVVNTQPQQQVAAVNLGQQYNLLPTSAEKLDFLNRVV